MTLIPEGARLAHSGLKDLFGPQRLNLNSLPFPDSRTHWLTRSHFAQLYPFAGIAWGRRYEFNPSPEGLDSFFTFSMTQILPRLKDSQRLRILEASGVNFLLLGRSLNVFDEHDVFDEERARLRARTPIPVGQLHVYELPQAAEPVQWITNLHRAPHMNATLDLMTSPNFDPRRDAVIPQRIPASGEPAQPVKSPATDPEATARISRETADVIEIRVNNAKGGFLLIQRTYQEIYRATVDGRPTPLLNANLHRLGIEVPAGSSQVRIWADRTPGRFAWALAGMALAILLAQLAIRRKVPST